MKHWNKNKKYREREWIAVDVMPDLPEKTVWWAPAGLMRVTSIKSDGPRPAINIGNAKRWCQQNGSDSRFLVQPYVGKFWFENSEDALAFKLKWT